MTPVAVSCPGALPLLLCAVLATGCATPPPAGPPQHPTSTHTFRATNGPVISSPLVADLDGDPFGEVEIAVGSWDGYFYVMNSELEDLPGWPRYSRAGYFSSPAAADLDGDGSQEIVVGSEAGLVYAWDAGGRDLAGWPVNLRHRIWASPTILPGPRVAIGGAGLMFVLDATGRPVKGWPRPILGWADSTLAAAPSAAETRMAGLVAVTTLAEGVPDAGAVHAWRMDGVPLESFPYRLPRDSDSSPALADIDGDGALDIVVGDDAGLLHVLGQDGEELPGFPQPTGSLIEASPSIGDLDGDGNPEIVAGSWDARMYVWERDGDLMPGWPVRVGDQIISSAALADLTGDGLPDIIAGSKDGYLYGWNGRGEPLPGFPVDLGAYVFSSPWVGDLNSDGRADLVVGANNGIHLLWDVGSLGTAPWPRFHRDDRNSGWAAERPAHSVGDEMR